MGYDDVMRQRVVLAGERITLHTKAGLVAWEEIEAAQNLLAEEAHVADGARVLVLESGAGALAVLAARQGGDVFACDGSLLAARMTRATLAANDVNGTVFDAAAPPANLADTFDVAILTIPKGRAYTRTLLAGAARALKPGGRLYLAGPNAAGAKAIVQDAAEILGRCTTVRTKARNRVAIGVRLATSHSGSTLEVAPPGERYHEFEVDGLGLFGTPGVFSWEGLDDGTACLLNTLDAALCEGQRVLDVGCGAGVVGLTAARLGAAAVDMVDASWLAVDCAQQGIMANRFTESCRAWASDLYSDVEEAPYDLILSNPPFHVGHAVEMESSTALITGAHDRLRQGGRLRIVANLFLPYDRLLRKVFGAGSVRLVYEDTRYRVLEAVR